MQTIVKGRAVSATTTVLFVIEAGICCWHTTTLHTAGLEWEACCLRAAAVDTPGRVHDVAGWSCGMCE